ncbi:MAG: dipeptidase [Armatimonadota bacterium]|jgi:membrane dipeptidase
MQQASAEAQAVHERAIIIDGHNDSLIARMARGDAMDFVPDAPGYHVDLPRMRAGGVTALFSMVGDTDLVRSLRLMDAVHEHVRKYPDDFMIPLTAGDIRRAKAEGKVALVCQLESSTCLCAELASLRMLHQLGVRVAGVTHGEAPEDHGLQKQRSHFDFCTLADREHARTLDNGLTDFGRDAVQEMNRLGIVIDLSHANDCTFVETLELTTRPVVFSHGNAFALSPHWRNLTDDQLRALAGNGGVIGISFVPKFVQQDEQGTLDQVVDHMLYVIELIGEDHVGIGADFDGMGRDTVPAPAHAGLLPELTETMAQRGMTDEAIAKVLGGNFLRVLERVIGQ